MFKRSLLALWLLLAAVLPAQAVIGTPTTIGANAGGTGTTSIITVTGAGCAVGSTALYFASYTTIADTLSSVADSKSNVWHAPVDNLTRAGVGIGFSYSTITVALVSSDTVTGTFGGSTVNTSDLMCISGLTASPLDTSAHSANGTAATSATIVSTGTLAQANEIVIGILGNATARGAIVSVTPLTIANNTNSIPSMATAQQIVAVTSSVSWTPTWTTSAIWITDIVSFKGAAAAGGPPGTTMGVGQ